MVCRCSSQAEHENNIAVRTAHNLRSDIDRRGREIRKLKAEIAALTPDNTNYVVEEAIHRNQHLILRVRYQGCQCAYGGAKVLVFQDVTPEDALKWKRIDPHFREAAPKDSTDAPSPVARFPADGGGWEAACRYVDAV